MDNKEQGEHVGWFVKRYKKYGAGFVADLNDQQNFGTIQLQHIDLSGCDLVEANFRSASMDFANFNNADLRNADFRGTALRFANLEGANLEGAKFLGSNLTGTILQGKHVPALYDYIKSNNSIAGFREWLCANDTEFDKYSLLDLSGIQICGLESEQTDLSNTDLKYATIKDTNLEGSILNSANFHESRVVKSNLSRSDLKHIKAYSSSFGTSNFSSSTIVKAEFKNCDFYGLDFTSSNLAQTKLHESRLINCIFKKANIIYTNFQQANLNNSDMRRTSLSLGYLDEDRVNQIDHCEFNGAKLTNTNWEEENLSYGELSEVDLFRANFRNANLSYANLSGSNLDSADLREADLRFAKGLLLNNTRIEGAIFEAKAMDPWSVLRRAYTGPNLVLILVLSSLFFLPLIGKILFWRAINLYQTISTDIEVFKCGHPECEETRVLSLLFGADQGWLLIATISVFIYNILRAYLTFGVSTLRDAETRSGYSPAWSIEGRPIDPVVPTKPMMEGVLRLMEQSSKFAKCRAVLSIYSKNILGHIKNSIFKLFPDKGYKTLFQIHRACQILLWASVLMLLLNLFQLMWLPIYLPK